MAPDSRRRLKQYIDALEKMSEAANTHPEKLMMMWRTWEVGQKERQSSHSSSAEVELIHAFATAPGEFTHQPVEHIVPVPASNPFTIARCTNRASDIDLIGPMRSPILHLSSLHGFNF